MRVLVLGAGFGGLELTTRLSESLGDDVEVTLIDRADGFIMGFSKLDVMFGRTTAEHVEHRYADLAQPGVRFVQSTITSIDPHARRVETDAGPFDADVLVVALGADLEPAATPGLLEAGIDFYSPAGAFAARDTLAAFEGGRVIVGVTSTPFKCPPAPSETALMMHDYLTRRGLRDASEISLVMPLPTPIPPAPEASEALLAAFDDRGIDWVPEHLVTSLDPARKVATFADGGELAFDLFLGVPKHRVPDVVAESDMCVDGWIPVDPLTLETSFADVYAIGDVTSVGTPKAGVFSERQGGVVADRLIARHRGATPDATYDGVGACYIEYGHDTVAKVEVTFRSGERPTGTFEAPSASLLADKGDFGSSRARRWFGTDWSNY
ncbi:MAG TPA: FAD-dependent oxidoreductase [Acidimicrobiales bacterium]|nr:FAD-dependent oxidoreductase [Acidimicrobiales bacterium]